VNFNRGGGEEGGDAEAALTDDVGYNRLFRLQLRVPTFGSSPTSGSSNSKERSGSGLVDARTTTPWHEWTEHQGAPWQRTFSSRDPGGVRSIHAKDL